MCFWERQLLTQVLLTSLSRSASQATASEKQYWAKGTGFGTGSTTSGWDIEQAMMKQRAEEEHVTYLLQVTGIALTHIFASGTHTNLQSAPKRVEIPPTPCSMLFQCGVVPTGFYAFFQH